MVRGRDMGLTSHEAIKIFQELNRGNKKYAPNFELCKHSGCRKGIKVDSITEKTEICPNCGGWGILKKG